MKSIKPVGLIKEWIILKRVLITLAGVILGTIMGHIIGWILPFLLFGDGSDLYLWLKSFGIEPYVVMVLTMTIVGALAGGITGYVTGDPKK